MLVHCDLFVCFVRSVNSRFAILKANKPKKDGNEKDVSRSPGKKPSLVNASAWQGGNETPDVEVHVVSPEAKPEVFFISILHVSLQMHNSFCGCECDVPFSLVFFPGNAGQFLRCSSRFVDLAIFLFKDHVHVRFISYMQIHLLRFSMCCGVAEISVCPEWDTCRRKKGHGLLNA